MTRHLLRPYAEVMLENEEGLKAEDAVVEELELRPKVERALRLRSTSHHPAHFGKRLVMMPPQEHDKLTVIN